MFIGLIARLSNDFDNFRFF